MLSPVSPAEEALLSCLPIVVKIVTAIAVLGGVVFFLLAYRLGRKIGYLVLAIAAALPLTNLRISTQPRPENQGHAMPADAQYGPARPAIVTQRATIPLVSLVICSGAFLLYRDERRKARVAGSDTGDRAGSVQ